MIKQNIAFLAVCAILALLLAPAYPIGHVLTGRDTQLSFSDNDEMFYLPLAQAMGRRGIVEFFAPSAPSSRSMEEEGVQILLDEQAHWVFPYDVTFFVLGKIASITGVSMPFFGYLLDLLALTLGMFLFWKFHEAMGCRRHAAFVGAFVTVALPWCLSPQALGITPHISLGQYQLLPFGPDHSSCLPLTRFGPTQISLVVFGVALTLMKRLFENLSGEERLRGHEGLFGVLGIIVGATVYIYVFAFITLVVMVSVLFALHLRSSGLKRSLRTGAVFAIALGSIAAPGLAILARSDGSYEVDIIPGSPLRFLFCYSLEWIVVALVSLLFWSTNRQKWYRGYMELLVVSAVTLHLAYWIQPLTGKIATPYHFSIFFLTPLFSGSIAAMIVQLVPLNRGTFARVVAASILGVVLNTVVSFDTLKAVARSVDSELLAALPLQADVRTVAVLDSAVPFSDVVTGVEGFLITSNLLNALGFRAFPPNQVLYRVRRSEYQPYLENDLLLGWIYSGNARLSAQCPRVAPQRWTDLHFGIFDWTVFQRIAFCSAADQLLAATQSSAEFICSLARRPSNRLSHLLVNTEAIKETPTFWEGKVKEVWVSSSGQYQLWRVNWDAMVEYACHA